MDSQRPLLVQSEMKRNDCHGFVRAALVSLCTLSVLFLLIFLFCSMRDNIPVVPCGDTCSIQLVESIPSDMTFPAGSPRHTSIVEAWCDLIQSAEETIDIAAFYWSLRDDDLKPYVNASHPGQKLFDTLIEVTKKRKLKVRIVVDAKQDKLSDTRILEEEGVAEVRRIDMEKLIGGGVLHTKMWLVDSKHFSVGSANLDWRSLTEVKEVSAIVRDCPCYGDDLSKIFEIYWDMAEPGAKIPSDWPSSLSTQYNKDTPLKLFINHTETTTYLASSPPQFCPEGRTTDIDAILDVMDKATEFIDIEVMTYLPMEEFGSQSFFWDTIDAKLRERAFGGRLKVRLMTGYWNHTDDATAGFLQSLAALKNSGLMNIEVRQFVVPLNSFPVNYSRVNHCKFMVTDNAAYVGTSNWAADYFTDTGGIGLIINNTVDSSGSSQENTENFTSESFQSQLRAVFERDWSSKYVYPVTVSKLDPPPLG